MTDRRLQPFRRSLVEPVLATAGAAGRAGTAVAHGATLPTIEHFPTLVFVLAAVPFVAQALGADPSAIVALRGALPIGVVAPDRILALFSAAGLVSLALGLHRHKQLMWRLATLTLVAGLVTQLMTGTRPIALAVAAIGVIVLAVDHRRYVVQSADRWSLSVAWILALSVVAVVVEAALAIPNPARDVRVDIRTVLLAISSWAAFGDRWLALRHGISSLNLLAAIFARLMAALAAVGSLRGAGAPALTGEALLTAREIAERDAVGPLRSFQLRREMKFFRPDAVEAAVSFRDANGVAVVLGDPIGRPADRWKAFASFITECKLRDENVMVYQASSESRHALLEAGFACFQVGQEAIVRLEDFSLAGSRRANLRHTVTRAGKGGVEIKWFASGLRDGGDEALVEQMARVDAEWNASHPGNLGFTISHFDRERLRDSAVSVAVTARGEVAAFATFVPTGSDGGWVLDLMRRTAGSVPGAMEAAIAEAATQLRDQGAAYLSLGLAPLSGLSPHHGPIEERALAQAAEMARGAYDVKGLAFFKSKFDPLWVPRYGAVRHRRDLPAFAFTLLSLHLGGLRGMTSTAASLVRPAPPAGDAPAHSA